MEEKPLAHSSVRINKEQDCSLYEKIVRKLLLHVLQMPSDVNTQPAFIMRRKHDKISGYDQIFFSIISASTNPSERKKYQIDTRKYFHNDRMNARVTAPHDDFYVVDITFPDVDYSSITKVKDIHKKPGGNRHTMILVDARGREVSHWVSFGTSSPPSQENVSLVYECLD